MQKVITECFDEFTKKHFDKIRATLGVDVDTAERVQAELRRLNPKPGSSLGETEGRNLQQITPDFIVDTDDEGNVTFTLNGGNIPELKVSPSFAEMMEAYKNNKAAMSRRDKEALLYAKEKVERARGYIEAIKVRRRTLTITMQAIIDWQRRFFQDGDEADLKPMILKNIADKTGLDISTISRVRTDQLGHIPPALLLLRRLHHWRGRGAVDTQDKARAKRVNQQRRQEKANERRCPYEGSRQARISNSTTHSG